VAAPVETAPAPVELAPVIEDAGTDASDAAAEAAAPKKGSGLTANQSRIKQCCGALRNQAKSLGNSPEANQMKQIAGMCDTIALQAGPTKGGQAPELGPLRAMLMTAKVPSVCSGM